jgi:hypothetical protein
MTDSTIHEANPWTTPLRDLRLSIEGTPLAPIVHAFEEELLRRGITGVRPHFYLSTEWGVPFGSVSIAIPFYLARPDLTELHATQAGFVEGADPDDILRYLRHEMGHVICYAYLLYEDPHWVQLFGDIDLSYEEEYHPRPFNPDYVQHLPGWYAQKHPDEDWAETFAVWLTPGLDWRSIYASAPKALAKLQYCDRTLDKLKAAPPRVALEDADEDVNDLGLSPEQLYQELTPAEPELPEAQQQALREALAPLARRPGATASVAGLLQLLEKSLPAEIYRWTGYFPERTRVLLRRFAVQAERDKLTYPPEHEQEATAAIAVLLTAMAMNHVLADTYLS